MASSSSYKVILLADIKGKLDELYERIQVIEGKSGKFDYLFLVGRLLKDGTELKPYLHGEKKVTIPTYFISTVDDDPYLPPEGKELTKNLTYLGKSGVMDVGGLQVAYYASNLKNMDLLNKLNDTVEKSDFGGVDILLTNEWPKNLTSNNRDSITGPNAFEIIDNIGSDIVGKVATITCPRYHFSGSENPLYYERLPYHNNEHRKDLDKKEWHVTRFIGLASFLNDRKQKFMYAFNATPMKKMSTTDLYNIPSNTTPSPFVDEEMIQKKRTFAELEKQEEENYQSSRFPSIVSENKNRKTNNKESHPLMTRTEGCWFCLSNPDIEKHLIVSIGQEAYMALAKGGISPNHVLVIPIEHVSSVFTSYKKLELEAVKYKKAIVDCFKNETVVFWERSMVGTPHGSKHHAHLQAIPIPKSKSEDIVKVIEEIASDDGLEIVELKRNVKVNFPYVQIDVPSIANILVKSDKRGSGLLQFGRKLVATLLQQPDKEDWKNCTASKEEEISMADQFKRQFAQYDFTLQ